MFSVNIDMSKCIYCKHTKNWFDEILIVGIDFDGINVYCISSDFDSGTFFWLRNFFF